MMPEPTTADKQGPTNSAAMGRQEGVSFFSDTVDFFLERRTVKRGEW
jgi:hypothetical protein